MFERAFATNENIKKLDRDAIEKFGLECDFELY